MAVSFALFAVYLCGIAPGLFWRDSMEFCLIGHQLDIGHPAGSPTFSLLAKLISFLQFGSLAWRANLLSALAAVAAVWLLWQATAQWLRLLNLASGKMAFAFGACAALAFAFSQSFWAWSEVAEVYSLQAAMLAGLFWLSAIALDKDDARAIVLVGLLLGLSCGVHMVQILYVPAFGLALLVGPRLHIRWKALGWMALFFLVGFAVFAYLPVRSATPLPYDYGNPETLDAFVAQITGRRYAGIIHQFPWQQMWRNLSLLPLHLANELNPLLAVMAAVGLVALAVFNRRGLLLVVLLTIGHLYLYVKDWHKAFGYIPLFMVYCLVGTIGLAWLWKMAAAKLQKDKAETGIVVIAILALAMAGWGYAFHFGFCDRSTHDLAQRHGRAILDSMPEGAVLVGFQDHLAYNVFYQQTIERWRPDVRFIHRAWLPFEDELKWRFPSWDFTLFNANKPGAIQHWLLANGSPEGVFWDYGWENEPWIDQNTLAPYGMVFQLTDQVWDGEPTEQDQLLWQSVYLPILNSPMVAPQGYDWTAQEVYARAFHLRAKIHADARRWQQAEAEERIAVGIYSDFAEHRAFLGLTLLAQNKFQASKEQLDLAVELDPYSALCWQAMAQLNFYMNNVDGAFLSLMKAYRLDRHNVQVALPLVRLLLQQHKWEKAIEVAQNALPNAFSAVEEARLQMFIAHAYVSQEACDSAKPHYEKALKLAPDTPGAGAIAEKCGFKLSP